MPTNDEIRAMAERLESPTAAYKNDVQTIHPTLFQAAAMLRELLAERESFADDLLQGRTIRHLKAQQLMHRQTSKDYGA